MDDDKSALLDLTTDIVSSFVANNRVQADAIAALIQTVHAALGGLGGRVDAPAPSAQKPAIAIGKSIQPEYLVCLEDGAHLKMMKRYLRARFSMTPEEYRIKWKLPADYPMVAPAYSVRRSQFAKTIGLGRGVRRPSEASKAPKPARKPRAPKT